MKKYICIDIGGTAIKYGIVDETGRVLRNTSMKTEAWLGGASILNKTVGIVEKYLKEDTYSGVCISTAGMVDIEKGSIFYSSPLIPDYTGTAFKKTMEERFQIPCEVENDVNCAGLAEAKDGAGKDAKSMLMLTIGTGIGGCLVVDGKVFRGCSGSACEVGYMHMDGSDFQTLGAASILTKKVAECKQENVELWNGYRIFKEAKNGDPVCIQAIDEMTEVLGKGIANICYVVNPEVVVLGGGIMAQREYLKNRLENALNKYLVPAIAKHTVLKFAEHENKAGMLGAFYHFRQRQEE